MLRVLLVGSEDVMQVQRVEDELAVGHGVDELLTVRLHDVAALQSGLLHLGDELLFVRVRRWNAVDAEAGHDWQVFIEN